eukprot:CAMPEP_0118674352 /NCGR_PEP_ID=MMETSP0800-20121206/841_1 /TAXON_ID=210618 ORGANISM="Striatella unipunctata, Strain CCMP2910" /NCGR_SAMPLE_ID=MMETSP0800 /ASSEMBLY_ACC=CAM_ASM_000638 /LENGTH=280 /DNA_ID=CAMNT_0006569539 /DNA_START=64 /DNA_END=906 /DNA_ORIENTATION=-
MTYNVWFGEPYPKERMEAISRICLGEMPLVIGFQEVTPMLAPLLFPQMSDLGYKVLNQPGLNSYGVAIALHSTCTVVSSGFLEFRDSIMGRGLLWIHFRVDNVEILFSTTHLESFVPRFQGKKYDGAKEREAQVKQIETFCSKYIEKNPNLEAFILTGDLNWDDQSKKNLDKPLLSVLDKTEWKDAWLELKPGDDGYTYDAKESPMLGGYLRRRFDRCVATGTGNYSFSSAHLVGKEPLEGLIWQKQQQFGKKGKSVPVLPSDHYGLHVTLSHTNKDNED